MIFLLFCSVCPTLTMTPSSNMKQVLSCVMVAILGLGEIVAAGAVQTMNDTDKYPACIEDNDCRRLENHACFQYFCYPWQAVSAVATDLPMPLNLCRGNKDCPRVGAEKQECFRHHDKRKITSGICVPSIDTCTEHDDCEDKGGKCCNGYCCNEVKTSANFCFLSSFMLRPK